MAQMGEEMAWIICIGCHHAVEIKKLKRNARLCCSACGSRVARVVRVIKQRMLNGGQMPSDVARAMTYKGLVSIAFHKAYKPGWAARKYMAIYGSWPDGLVAEPANPSGELMWWIRRQNAEYAKARKAEEGPKPLPLLAGSELMTDDDWAVEL